MQAADVTELLRIGNMTQAMLDELRNAPLDEELRGRLSEVHRKARAMVEQAVSPELRGELAEFGLPLEDGTMSDAELRLAHAQLVGWLNGLFTGIQVAATSRSQRRQLEQLQQQLEQGSRRPESGRDDGAYL